MLTLDNLREIWNEAEPQHANLQKNEQATKNALIEPFMTTLGYNTRNTNEVSPEYPVVVGGNMEWVDYAILQDGNPIILIECKSLDTPLDKDIRQLYEYFTPTAARFGVLTNGVVYRFFSDLKTSNVMDQTPFWEVDIRSADEADVARLRQFAKDKFDVAKIKASAVATNIITGVKANIEKMYDNPDDEFSETLFRNLVAGELAIEFAATPNRRELVKQAFHQFVSDRSGTESGAEISQEMSAGESQSAPAQAPAAVILPDPSPIPPTDGWQSLSDIQPKRGDARPAQMMFPDDSSVVIRLWRDVAAEAVRWLTNNRHLDTSHCPIQYGAKYLVATDPIHPNGKKFDQAREVNSLHVELHYSAPDTIRNAKVIIERAGLDASQFKVSWRAPEQDPAAVIPPIPSPTPIPQQTSVTTPTPTSGWQSLSEVQPEHGIDRPIQMMLPDNSPVAISAWNQVVIQTIRWLTNNGHLDARHCPIQYASRYLVAIQPVHPNGKAFTSARNVNSLYVELNYPGPDTIRNVKIIIERTGLNASQFKLRW